MVMKPGPVSRALESIDRIKDRSLVLLLTPQGRTFDQPLAWELSRTEQIILICGRYEGVDERVAQHLADEEISIGNFVLSGGELAAAVLIDAIARLLPGVGWMRRSCWIQITVGAS